MKRYTLYMICALAATLSSCIRNDRIFSSSASARIDDAIDLYSSALLARRTWVMEYFPDDQLRYGGWVYVLEFRQDHSVEAWFEGSGFVPQSNPTTVSEYAVEFSTGPMLKFCTNNDYIHYFSFPGGLNGGGYQGYKGDYEFTVMSLNEAMDEMILRGIRTGNCIRLTPLPGEWTPQGYVDAVWDGELSVRKNSFDIMVDSRKVGKISRACTPVLDDFQSFYKSKIWTVEYDGQTQDICTITLPGGILKAYSDYTFEGGEADGLSFRSFRWIKGDTADEDRFVCVENDKIELR